MTGWRFCGRFNPMTQDTVTDEYSWIDEAEAKRRYHDPSKELTIVPPVDPVIGIVPYYITVTTAEQPAFVATIQQPPGVERIQLWWKNLGDGRLFCDTSIVFAWPPVEQIRRPGSLEWRMRNVYRNKEDGTGTVDIVARDADHVISAKRKDIPVDQLYLPVPAWGEWDVLANGPPHPEDPESDSGHNVTP